MHPFNDGNGRIGRLLIVVQLLQRRIIQDPLITVSPWIEARRIEYQDELQRVSKVGDFDRWVCFFSGALRDQADDTTRKIDELLQLRNRFSEVCQARRIRGTALLIAQGLIGRPIINPTWVQKHFRVSYPTANSAVTRLEAIGLVRETTGGKYGRNFVAEEVLRVFSRRVQLSIPGFGIGLSLVHSIVTEHHGTYPPRCVANVLTVAHRATLNGMAQTISQRELRNDSGKIMRRLDQGECFVITRNGQPVGELTPLRRHRFVSCDAVAAIFSCAPGIDFDQFRADLEEHASQEIEPRG